MLFWWSKTFLSIHSEFFKVLFFGNLKEARELENIISDISYYDFGLLLSTSAESNFKRNASLHSNDVGKFVSPAQLFEALNIKKMKTEKVKTQRMNASESARLKRANVPKRVPTGDIFGETSQKTMRTTRGHLIAKQFKLLFLELYCKHLS
ncbi:hypothetical protein B9Z55_009072 [Caenorhabditis nigoni]|uniref:BTB domain-containing protein n=2 Tax=Caenorhabditis nigoni TaxID=1611254 RepID=A0A2G5UQH9_9PELO|nr:hypothetical protein B9Z55_009072 [Caenorhabditis nigoni]